MRVFEEEINDMLRTLQEWYYRYAPQIPDEPQDDRFLYALHTRDYADYLADQFRQADQAGRLAMWEEIERLEYEIRVLAESSLE